MIGFLVPLIARVGVPERFRRGVAIASTVIAIAGLCALLWTCWLGKHDRGVIDNHEAGIDAQVTLHTNAANDVANTNDAVRRENDARADEQLREVIRDAQEKHPVEVRHDAGPAVRNVLGELRQRAAKASPAASK